MHEDVQFSGNIYFTVYGRKQTFTRVLQCSPASVGLAQARPNKARFGGAKFSRGWDQLSGPVYKLGRTV